MLNKLNINMWNELKFELRIKMELYAEYRSEGVSTWVVEKKKPEKVKAWTGIELMTSATPVQCKLNRNDIERPVLNGMLEPFVGGLIKKNKPQTNYRTIYLVNQSAWWPAARSHPAIASNSVHHPYSSLLTYSNLETDSRWFLSYAWGICDIRRFN